MSNKPSILVHPEEKGRQTSSRHTVTFADDFDPRSASINDVPRHSQRSDSPPDLVDRTSSIPSRRSSNYEPPVLLDDDELPRLTKRNGLPLTAGSRSALAPPSTWHPAGTVYRFIVLSTVAFILTTGYFSDETIGATNSELRAQMNLTPKEIGWIYSASYGPNIIMIFLGGFLVDKFGVRLMSLIYTTLVVFGLGIFALVPTLWGKIIGRVVFGSGFEPLEVCSDAIVMRWYGSTRVESKDGLRKYRVGAPSIPLAFSLLFSTGIFGQFLSLNVLPAVLKAFDKNLRSVYLLVTAIGVAALLVNVLFAFMDWYGSRKLELEATASEAISFKVLTHFPLTYWLLMGVCVAGYSCQYVFMIYASDYIHEKWGFDDIVSGNWASIVYLFAIVLSPVVGYFVERRGQALTLMGMGCLFFAFGCIIMGSISPNYLPAVPLVLMGIAYSLVPATVWSSISDVIPEPLAGTGFGIMTAIMSFTYLIIPSGVGLIHDAFNSYDNMNYVFAIAALVSFGGVLWIAKIEPDLNLPVRARRKDLSAYNVLATDGGSDNEDEDLFEDWENIPSPNDQFSKLSKHQNASNQNKNSTEDNFNAIRDRYAGPLSPKRRPPAPSHSSALSDPSESPNHRKFASLTSKTDIGSPGAAGGDTELLTVTEDENALFSGSEDDRNDDMPTVGFSSSVIPDSWLANVKRGLDMPSEDGTISSSLPTHPKRQRD